MSPPPPPLGRGRRRAAQAFDEALDDADLVAARAALAQGRWQQIRSLLAQTGDDWDRRGHRITVLAGESYSAAWAREWLLAEPESADASVLLALAEVRRVLRGKGKPARAREACQNAVARTPADPTPGSACSCWSARPAVTWTWSGTSRRSAAGTPTTTTPTI